MTPRLTRTALFEVVEGALYYEREAGCGAAFRQAFDAAIEDICSKPEAWPLIRPQIRRRRLEGFEHGVVYRIQGNHIVVLAVMHLRRRPAYWAKRG